MIKRCCEYGNVPNLWSVNKLCFGASLFFLIFNASVGSFKDAIVLYEFFLPLTRTISKRTRMLVLRVKSKLFFIQSKRMGQFIKVESD